MPVQQRSLAEIRQMVAEKSPKAVADASGLGLSYICLILNGKRVPALPAAKRVADALGLSLDEFREYLKSQGAKV